MKQHEIYGFTSSAALHVVDKVIIKKRSQLSLQKYAINEFCSSSSPVITAHEFIKSGNVGREDTTTE